MQHLKRTFGSPLLIFGQKYTVMSPITQKHVCAANKEKILQTSLPYFSLCQHRTNPMSESMLTFLDLCLLLDVNTSASFASPTLSQSTCWSRRWRTRKPKLWQRPFLEWFCKFGIPAQIHKDGGKEFVNKLSSELFTLLNVNHTKTTLAHPQCNTQVEVFNKTVKKYLASFVDDTKLDWENFLPTLMLSYNMSYHSTIATTPFELLFSTEAENAILSESGHSAPTLQ